MAEVLAQVLTGVDLAVGGVFAGVVFGAFAGAFAGAFSWVAIASQKGAYTVSSNFWLNHDLCTDSDPRELKQMVPSCTSIILTAPPLAVSPCQTQLFYVKLRH